MDKQQINEKIIEVKKEISKKVVGQDKLIRDLLIGLLSKWHVLLEWAPWLAKTLSVDTLSKVVDLWFNRIQFTPDILPTDLVWSKIFNQETKEFEIKKGPIFTNLVLADEINRAPSKVQSALLEAMAEKQVSIHDNTFKLQEPFMVLATQNPLEQDGTYTLPEAQLDRFLLKTIVVYPSEAQELEIMKNETKTNNIKISKVLKSKEIKLISDFAESIYVDDNIYEYVKDIVFYTRNSIDLNKYLAYWASPRASIALIKAAKVLAMIEGRDFVIPEDIKEIAYPVLRHRLILNYEAIAEWITTDKIIEKILESVKVK